MSEVTKKPNSKGKLIAGRLELRVPEEMAVPADQHRAAYWLFMQLVQSLNPALAEELRRPATLRPFTVSNLLCPGAYRRRGQLWLTPEQPCYLRFTALNDPVAEVLEELPDQLPPLLDLGETTFESVELSLVDDPEARTGRSSYAGIIERSFYEDSLPSNLFGLNFLSPTMFRTEGQPLPLPIPRLVFGSLLQRWNAFSPGPLADDSRLFAELSLKLGYYHTRTRTVLLDQEHQTGFIGPVEFRATSRDRFYLQTLATLCDFSFYAGVGYKTTAGFGQAEALRPRPRPERISEPEPEDS